MVVALLLWTRAVTPIPAQKASGFFSTLLLRTERRRAPNTRITPADLPRWKKLLTDNFDANSVALANERPKLKTEQLSDAGKTLAVANTVDRVQAITAAVEIQMSKGLSYDAAHDAVRREQPELFKK